MESTPAKNTQFIFPKFPIEIDEEVISLSLLIGKPDKNEKIKDIALNIQELMLENGTGILNRDHLIKLGPLENGSQIERNHNAIGMASSQYPRSPRNRLFLQKRHISDSWHVCYGQTNKWAKKINLLKSSQKNNSLGRDIISDHYHLRPC